MNGWINFERQHSSAMKPTDESAWSTCLTMTCGAYWHSWTQNQKDLIWSYAKFPPGKLLAINGLSMVEAAGVEPVVSIENR
jgi:hypothetical protein